MYKYSFSFFMLVLFLISGCTEPVKKPSEQATDELLLHVPSPDWRDQVIYFLMTDRFNDGDPSNNDQGLSEYDPTKASHFSGGDIQGVIEQLDYLQNMGVTAVWTTPLVANQWWSNASNYGGYHGYWATDFSSVDAHLGELQTLKQLSDQLHRRGMYMIQDIVVNHTGNFFNYRNGQAGYNPEDTSVNFYFLEAEDSAQPKPTQVPFDLIDRNNPAHVEANIYNWTPSITDYKNVGHQFTYQLANLSDINTKNPVVIDRMKEIYGDWIKTVGVDAFRIDTVRYVEHEFFHHFMHDPNGIHAAAKATGRNDFLAFGEVFDTSKPFENDAEKRVASYLGSVDKPELNSQISFPLHQELKTVFAQGFPTAQLAYRIEQHMSIYPDPYIFPTFIDNHDMGRFLSSGDVAGLKQALATILTIPGIPTIYQGTAQAMTEARQAMFKGGFNADRDYFDQTSELYQYISTLAKLRTSDKLFTRGEFEVLASNDSGPGIFAYKRSYQGREVIVVMNTSSKPILLNNLSVSSTSSQLLPLFGTKQSLTTNKSGELTAELEARAVNIFELKKLSNSTVTSYEKPHFTTNVPSDIITESFIIEGKTPFSDSPLLLIKNNRLDNATEVNVNTDGTWQYDYPVNHLGKDSVTLTLYHPDKNLASNNYTFTTQVKQAEHTFNYSDPVNDDKGPTGKYSPPQHDQSIGQLDILGADVEIGGDVLLLTLNVGEITDDWIPPNGFDNVAFSIFFDYPEQSGATTLPLINTDMPDDWQWNLGHVVYGWGNTTFSPAGATAELQGTKFGIAPEVTVNKENKQITFRYLGSDFNLKSWLNTRIYITTWDISGEGVYRKLSPTASRWSFGGGNSNGAKILDSMRLELRP